MKNNNTSDVDKEQYILIFEKLEDGDIILERGYEIHSSVICKATGSNYSHAMIYAGNTIIEATQKGRVFSKIPNRFAVRDINDLKVLRLKQNLPPATMKKIVEYARQCIGTEYSLKEAVYSAKPNKMMKSTESQFCSRLVARSYSSAGVELVDNINFCTPADIERSEFLCEIPNMVRLGTDQEIAHAHANSLHDEHRESTANFCKNAMKILSLYKVKTVTVNKKQKNIATLNDIFQAVFERRKKIKQLDLKISELMSSTGYMDGPFHDKKQNPYRYDAELFAQKLNELDQTSGIYFLQSEVEKDLSHIEHRINNFLASKNNKKSKLKVYLNDYEINENMLKTMLQRTEVILSYCLKYNSSGIYDEFISTLNVIKNKLECLLK